MNRLGTGGPCPRPCVLCDGVSSWRPQRSGDHSPQLHKQMLYILLAAIRKGYILSLLTLLASMAVHMCLQRTWACEALVADLALVLLL
jgi:hypothetical protein